MNYVYILKFYIVHNLILYFDIMMYLMIHLLLYSYMTCPYVITYITTNMLKINIEYITYNIKCINV